MATPPKIKKLDEVVVNRIAAGEIIQRPANALKELIENSLDAKSTDIQITVKEGGLKLLQIQDNGTGIRKGDLDIVCERFTTSKLEKFEDLQSISTYGFRGEALASISHVAQLTITTKTAQEKVAYKASYTDSKLKSAPKPIAGNQGTIITIENLFYNVATRRKALENTVEQFTYIADVVTRYAIHNSGVGFTLKKYGVNTPVIRTPFKATKENNIKSLFGIAISRELIEVKVEDKIFKFKLEALFTNPNYSSKKLTLLLFINHRLVESTPIKKMLEDLYSTYLPKKTYPWVYISLEINPHNVDVNVHPTKSEVRFIHEDKVIDKVKSALDEKLSSNNSSRTFYIQARLPEVDVTKDVLAEVLPEYDEGKGKGKDKDKDKEKKVYAKEMIRVDHKEQKLDKFNFTVNAKDKSNETNELEKSLDNNNQEKELNNDFRVELNLKEEELETETQEGHREANDSAINLDHLEPGDNDLQINSHSLITSTQIEKDDRNQTASPLIPDSIAELYIDDSSSEVSLEPVPMSKSAEKAMKSVFRLFGSQEVPEKSLNENQDQADVKAKCPEGNQTNPVTVKKEKDSSLPVSNENDELPFKSYSINNFRRAVQITSVLQLRKAVEDGYHGGLRKLLSELKFIACIDEQLALIQSDVNLYICTTNKLAEELFYEIMLYDFANYGVLKFSEPLSIVELAMIGLDNEDTGWSESKGPKPEIAKKVRDLFIEKAEMLKEYFSIVITKTGYIKSLPMLLENYYPSEADLPLYILRMAAEVIWDEEKPCFDGICRETARFFSHINPNSEFYDWKHLTEHILYATIKESLLPPKHFAHDSSILKIASLPNLYKVFERC